MMWRLALKLFIVCIATVAVTAVVKIAIQHPRLSRVAKSTILQPSLEESIPAPELKVISPVTFEDKPNQHQGDLAVHGLVNFNQRSQRSDSIVSLSRENDRMDNHNTHETSGKVPNPVVFSFGDGQQVSDLPDVPPLEIEREQEERSLAESGQTQGDIRFSNNFECGMPFSVRQLSPNHFTVSVENYRRFLFRVENLKGKIIRIDIDHPNDFGKQNLLKSSGSHTNPLFSYSNDLSDPTGSGKQFGGEDSGSMDGFNGTSLPPTHLQSWHYLRDVWNSRPYTTSIVQRFKENVAYIGMRAPRPPSYNDKYFESLEHNPRLQVVKLGLSVGGRKLLLAKISSGESLECTNPCIVIYAGEHADEPDGMWAAEGMINFLTGETETAQTLRQNFTFLILPCEDPDASAAGMHEQLTSRFLTEKKAPENSIFANWFEAWVDKGKRLDMVIDLHNGGFDQPTQLACAMIESCGHRGKLSLLADKIILRQAASEGFSTQSRPWMTGWSPDRLGGWLTRRFGTFTLAYEFDSQCALGHMNIQTLQRCGAVILKAAAKCLDEPPTKSGILSDVDSRRSDRLSALRSFRPRASTEDAIDFEARLGQSAGSADKIFSDERWVP